MRATTNSSIIICSIVRDAERGLKRNIPQIKALCGYFKDFKVFVYENDSNDNTKNSLKSGVKVTQPHVFISLNKTNNAVRTISSVSESGDVNPFYSRKRIEKMADLRNSYMEFIYAEGWKADYLMVVDLDVAWIRADNILSSFEKDNWDAVTAYDYSLSPKLKWRNHDSYALTELGDENNPQTEYITKMLSEKYASMQQNNDWVRVFSAFGGLAIYRFECVKGLRYKAMDNDDKRVEEKCEHFSIYRQMADKGFDKVYINPKMVLKYQDLTIGIVWNSLSRMLRNLIGSKGFEIEYYPCVAFMVKPNYKCVA